MFFSKLYRLKLSAGKQGNKHNASYMWEIVKVRSQEPNGREEHSGVSYKGKYYIHGGNNPHIEGSALKDTWVLNLSNWKWSPLKDGPITRHCHGMWAANNKLYVLGGRTSIDIDGGPTFTFRDSTLINPAIEEFVSFDLESKVWKQEECVGNVRPHPLSEFPVLPLYDNDGDEEPSSILIWGGYAEPKEGEDYKAKYGDEEAEFKLCYRKRLLRFDVQTNVWKSIVPTSPILPKALAIMATVKRGNGVRHVLIGEGYGFDPDTNDRELSEKARAEWQNLLEQGRALGASLPDHDPIDDLPQGGCKPQYSHKLYDVQITESFGGRGNNQNSGWSWDLYNLPDEKMPQLVSMLAPCSSTLHHMIDFSIDDFVQPRCASIKKDDEKNLFGVRVLIHGLQGRKDLNGMVGRCGRWLKSERYEVFLSLYECGKKCGSLSVKVENLQIADPVKEENCLDFVTRNPHIPKAFPGICFILARPLADKRPLLEYFTDPAITSTTTSHPDKKVMTYFDTYRGPLSSRAHAIIRTMMDPSQNVNEPLICCNLIPQSFFGPNPNSKTAAMNVYANFVRDLKERDSVRVVSFEASLSEINDDMVEEKCGGLLKIDVQLDGVRPNVRRELLVNPAVTMRALHDQVLCPTMGWKSNFHYYVFRKTYDDPEKLKDSCWIGARQSTALDSMFMPLYVGGCVANDKQISIGQLFASEDTDIVTLQYIHDLGDWYSHQIKISKYDGQSLKDSTVACLVRGEGLRVPEDSGGLMSYCEIMRKITGRMAIEIDEDSHTKAFVDPSSEHWWRYFNAEVRNKHNMQSGLGNPLQFDLDSARNDLDTAIRRPTQKSGREVQNLNSIDNKTGLTREQDKKVTASLPKNATKMCAVCGVTVALRKCSGCQSIAYCSREHQLQHWKEHKAECK
eukprot:scaffold3268_cov171-Skeletonema_menzelii.AAC.2